MGASVGGRAGWSAGGWVVWRAGRLSVSSASGRSRQVGRLSGGWTGRRENGSGCGRSGESDETIWEMPHGRGQIEVSKTFLTDTLPHRQADSQTEIPAHTSRLRYTWIQTDRHIHPVRQMDKHTYIHTDKHTYIQTDRHIHPEWQKQTSRLTDTYILTDIHIQPNRHAHIHSDGQSQIHPDGQAQIHPDGQSDRLPSYWLLLWRSNI